MDYVLPENGRGGGEVLVGRVYRGADADLDRLRAGDLTDRHDIAGRGGLRDQGLELRELNNLGLVVRGAGVGSERDIVVLAPLGGEPLADPLVAREDGGGGSQLRDHVAYRASIRH